MQAKIPLGLFVLALLAHPARAQPFLTKELDALCKDAREQWQAPGLAIVIVQGDQIKYLKGFGVKKLGSNDPVTPDTLFPLASCTKPFTTLALATLVDDARLHWDDSVRKHVPFFKLADPLADAKVTLRDLLCHRTGVGTHDLLWFNAPWKLEDRIRKIAHLEMQHSFRSNFQYQTVLFGAAGLAGGNAAGSTWQEMVDSRVLKPLAMKNSFTTAPSLARYADQASPHRRDKTGAIEVIARYPLEDPDPAGSVHSTARDIAKFLRLQLAGGVWEGKRLVSAANLQETHAPQMVVRREGFARLMNPDTTQISYGLGWINQDYRGKLLLLHGGAIDGFRTQLTLVPQENMGLAIVNNLDRSFMNLALTQSILDYLWKLPSKDWNTFYLQIRQHEEAQDKMRHDYFLSRRQPGAQPSRPLAAFAGQFEDAAYGNARIALENDQLVCRWSSFTWPLEHLEKDTFYTSNRVVGDMPFDFQIGVKGEVAAVQFLRRTFRKK